MQLFASEPMMLSPASIDIDHRGRVWVCEVVNYRKHNGVSNGADRVQALDCEYMCAWAGVEFVDNAAQWIAGLIRG